ncbi:GNAT family N-acetyltransferase [Agrobacterium vitis]|uniref:GNAT family N-acetyltransferase n=1 Tax=Agrobacterium vitis TaxID=373 RepID=A0AAE2RBF1_AGRVI|nr:GNAT family N-acetyltransferase [Agrobacterium vitis]MBF2715343.1 GNAT family N-acetyltransferase [Agrobacterium vitis]MUZ64483.1 GNAT family N-acetyltransferase [Agrobacterium vitis]MVA17798.1 GNAT family N-acetyltransferase [Agrobacterium vitis]
MTNDISLAVLDEVPSDTQTLISGWLTAHNDVMFGKTGGHKSLFIPIEHHDGEILGGLIGRTARGWLDIDIIFIPEALRGQGLAGKLLALAENEACKRGCKGAHIQTANPVATKAYQKYGYEVFGTIEHFIDNFALTMMVKRW